MVNSYLVFFIMRQLFNIFFFNLVIPERTMYEVTYSKSDTFQCQLIDFPNNLAKTVKWIRRSKGTLFSQAGAYKDFKRGKAETTNLKTSLTIQALDENDSGFYRCIIQLADKIIRSEEIELRVYERKCQSNSVF